MMRNVERGITGAGSRVGEVAVTGFWIRARAMAANGAGIRGRSAAALAVAVLLGGAAASLEAAEAPAVGNQAPDFTLPYATADTIVFQGESLKDAVARGPVLLAFYPADWSPGCTREVCTFRDSFTDLSELGLAVWGISGDQPFSHKAWAEHHKLPFRLLSDLRHDVARAYGSFNDENGFNRRTVFVVGTDGKIGYADTDYSVADSTDFHALRSAVLRVAAAGRRG